MINRDITSPELNAICERVKILVNRKASIRAEICERETRQNDANIIKAKIAGAYHKDYVNQPEYAKANAAYHAEGNAISARRRELTHLEHDLSEAQRAEAQLRLRLSEEAMQQRYEAETVEGNRAKIFDLSNCISEKNAAIDKCHTELAALGEKETKHRELEAGHDRYKAEYEALKAQLDKAEAAYTLDASLPNPTALRTSVADAKKKYDHCVKNRPTQALFDLIANKRESLQGEIAVIEAEKAELQDARLDAFDLINDIQICENLAELLSLVKTKVACDQLRSVKGTKGEQYLAKLQNEGLCLPVTFRNSPSIFNGLLDNLDEVKARINAEFEREATADQYSNRGSTKLAKDLANETL